MWNAIIGIIGIIFPIILFEPESIVKLFIYPTTLLVVDPFGKVL